MNKFDFDSIAFFKDLCENNRMCREFDFRFVVCSGLEGFEDALHQAQDAQALIAVDDSADGALDIDNTPHKKSFRSVFMFMRHSVEENWHIHRTRCFEIMREIFRQFLSVLIRQKARLRLENVVLNSIVSFHEIPRYFFTGGACAWFQIEIDKYISLELNSEEWIKIPMPPKLSSLDENTPMLS